MGVMNHIHMVLFGKKWELMDVYYHVHDNLLPFQRKCSRGMGMWYLFFTDGNNYALFAI